MHMLFNRTKRNQDGFASLVIGLVLILVMSLMAVGFAQLSRHEQNQALSNQLASQAYYAAESGVNDTFKKIQAGTITGTTPEVISGACITADSKGAPVSNQYIGPSGLLFKYQCVKVSMATNNLGFSNFDKDTGKSLVFSVSPNINPLTITWSSADGKTASRANSLFAQQGNSAAPWNSPAVIQFSITPLSAFDRNSLIANTHTAYLFPGGSANTNNTSYNSMDPAPILGSCDATGLCTVKITGIPNASSYLIHLVDFYDKSNVTIQTSPNTTFTGQPTIDVTGKAKNVLKRIKVRVPLNSGSQFNYAIEAGNVCKRFTANSSQTNFDTGSSDSCDVTLVP